MIVCVGTHHTHDRVIRFGARARKKHTIELRLADFLEHCRQFDGWRMRTLEEVVVVRKLLHLRGRRIDQLLPAIACIYTPQARHAIKNFVAVGIKDVNALGTRDDA
jgi:hypothetical protein